MAKLCTHFVALGVESVDLTVEGNSWREIGFKVSVGAPYAMSKPTISAM